MRLEGGEKRPTKQVGARILHRASKLSSIERHKLSLWPSLKRDKVHQSLGQALARVGAAPELLLLLLLLATQTLDEGLILLPLLPLAGMRCSGKALMQ